MNLKNLFLLLLFFGISTLKAQTTTSLSLHDAVSIALKNSHQMELSNTKVATKKLELQTIKNNQYPDFKISAQYLRLTNATIDLKKSNPQVTTAVASPNVDQLVLGQANLSFPIFAGFRLQNSIIAAENSLQAETAFAENEQEETAIKVVRLYADLYKAQQSALLFVESLKSSQQRVVDFKALESNGIIAKNDLLKAQLQASKIELSLVEAQKNTLLLNYNLVDLLQLAPETKLLISPNNIDPNLFSNAILDETSAIENRKDLKAVRFLEKASQAGVKIAKGSAYPSLALIGGYTSLNLQNVVTVENAINFGIGFSYNVSSIFKNPKEIATAKSKVKEVQQQAIILTDLIKFQRLKAQQEYDFSVKQDQVFVQIGLQTNENYRIVKDKFDNGLATTNELLEADVEQLNAKMNMAFARANVALKYYELLANSGQVLQSFNYKNN